MGSLEEKVKSVTGSTNLLDEMKLLKELHQHDQQTGTRKSISSELWHACAGPLVSLPLIGSLVYYFPQGHSEQVAVSTKRSATSQIPNYPNLPSQLLCQVQNVTLHADRETDEIYAQMSLQPVNSEKDVFTVPDFGLKPSKHPTEFFCKTLTASDTSTHGGFSVPRRAAEKLFPPLDYTMQPPNQELVVRDLHDNTWTFRHIYRGQPKRHLLTTGWSLFVGAKRLRAGDSVLFIRDEKSQLMVGVRRANRQQSTLPSSVLSADSMHIGVLAAAAHAAASRSPFTIYYNPRACPSEFVIPLTKFRKAVYGTQLSVGMRFGMMFETDESGKRRYMGTIVAMSDVDPLRWPGSKWRNLQVEWDEPGCCDKQNRVSSWEIETPESLFIFPSLTSGLKRPLHPGYLESDWGNMMKRAPFMRVPENMPGDLPYPISNLYSEQLMKMLMKPQTMNYQGGGGTLASLQHESASRAASESFQAPMMTTQQNQISPPRSSVDNSTLSNPNSSSTTNSPTTKLESSPKPKIEKGDLVSTDQMNSQWSQQPQFDSLLYNPSSDLANLNSVEESMFYPPGNLPFYGFQDYPDSNGFFAVPSSASHHEIWDNGNVKAEAGNLNCVSKSEDESNNQSGIYSLVVDPILDDLCTMKNVEFQTPATTAECVLAGSFSTSQDVQSQITSASLADSRTFSKQENNSGGTSSSNLDLDDTSLLHSSSWQQVVPPVRTYTKVQKAGSVGRSIDVSSFKNYEELCSAIECMFGLEGLLNDPRGSGWKLVYVDYENDVLLVGDDPWEEFVGCVRCIRILSPTEVQQMSEEGMKLLNSAAMQGINAIPD